jgi:hypothetical protein
MREGAKAEGVKSLLLEMGKVSKWLKDEMKATPVWGRDTRETVAQHRRKGNDKGKDQKPKQPPAPTAAPPPAQAQAGPPPPPTAGTTPPAPGQAAVPAADVKKVTVETTSFVRVTMPKDKVVVEFWRSGRKWPELRWAVGGEALMEIAPTLAAAGWTAEHFDTVGAEYQIPLNVHWIPSPKDAKYKDIIKVELVQAA